MHVGKKSKCHINGIKIKLLDLLIVTWFSRKKQKPEAKYFLPSKIDFQMQGAKTNC